MSNKISRRATLAGVAAMVPITAVASSTPDARLIRLGARLEPLLIRYFEETAHWAPLMRAGHVAGGRAAGVDELVFNSTTDEQRAAYIVALNAELGSNGYEVVAARLHNISERIEPIVESIIKAKATSLDGLRAMALAWLFEVRPSSSDNIGGLCFSDDGGISESVFYAIAELTGLTPLVRTIEKRLVASAAAVDAIKVGPAARLH